MGLSIFGAEFMDSPKTLSRAVEGNPDGKSRIMPIDTHAGFGIVGPMTAE